MRQSIVIPIFASVVIAALAALAVAAAIYPPAAWESSISSQSTRPLLLTILGAQATVLAIALAFGVLYAQFTLDTYSLRAAGLLLRQRPFLLTVGWSTFSMVLVGAFSLLVDNHTDRSPMVLALAGGLLFVSDLAIMIAYIADVVISTSPEAILDNLSQSLSKHSVFNSSPILRRGRTSKSEIHIPRNITTDSSVSDDFRILVDTAKRMVLRSDHRALQNAI